MFYMPHGLTIDVHGNYWLTDVILHQVFKVRGNERPSTDNKKKYILEFISHMWISILFPQIFITIFANVSICFVHSSSLLMILQS